MSVNYIKNYLHQHFDSHQKLEMFEIPYQRLIILLKTAQLLLD